VDWTQLALVEHEDSLKPHITETFHFKQTLFIPCTDNDEQEKLVRISIRSLSDFMSLKHNLKYNLYCMAI